MRMRTRYPTNFLPAADPAFLLKKEERPLAPFPQHLRHTLSCEI